MTRAMSFCGAMSVAVWAACGGVENAPINSDDSPTVEERQDSIVGGQLTNAFPGVGAISAPAFGGPFCTGTLIAPLTVLTAAHCLDAGDASSFRFVGGQDALHPSWSVAVTGGAQHGSWTGSGQYDIAVLFLAEEPPVEPLPISTALPSDVVGKTMRFVGYGVTDGVNQTGAGKKREVTLSIVELSDTEFAYADQGKNTCNGDSGGPAFFRAASGQWEVAGVTSRGDRDCEKYGIYTRVDAFEAFISAQLR